MVCIGNQRQFLFGVSANLFWIGTSIVLLLLVAHEWLFIFRSLFFSNNKTEECETNESLNTERFDVTYVSQSR